MGVCVETLPLLHSEGRDVGCAIRHGPMGRMKPADAAGAMLDAKILATARHKWKSRDRVS